MHILLKFQIQFDRACLRSGEASVKFDVSNNIHVVWAYPSQTQTVYVTVDWLLLTRWRSVVRHVTMRARATRRVVS